MAYKVLSFDLSTVRDRELIAVTQNSAVSTISVIQLPSGADVTIHLEGPTSDPWPLLNQGLQFKACPPERKGIHLSNPQGGGILKLGISYSQ